MIGLAAGKSIWIVAGVADLRRGFVGLSGVLTRAKVESGKMPIPLISSLRDTDHLRVE
jgi:hypothetical protein